MQTISSTAFAMQRSYAVSQTATIGGVIARAVAVGTAGAARAVAVAVGAARSSVDDGSAPEQPMMQLARITIFSSAVFMERAHRNLRAMCRAPDIAELRVSSRTERRRFVVARRRTVDR